MLQRKSTLLCTLVVVGVALASACRERVVITTPVSWPRIELRVKITDSSGKAVGGIQVATYVFADSVCRPVDDAYLAGGSTSDQSGQVNGFLQSMSVRSDGRACVIVRARRWGNGVLQDVATSTGDIKTFRLPWDSVPPDTLRLTFVLR
jgi:hypothetical protein